MDLPSCPACGQSVLDNDVVDCPFCGASMSGGQPASPAASSPPTPQPTQPEVPAEAASTAPGPPTAEEGAAGEADDLFGIDPDTTRTAIPMSPRRAQGHSLEVVCPMCEAVGYVSRRASGRDVRCTNPDCLVPVFTAPRLEKPPPAAPAEAEPTPRRGGGLMLAVLLVAVLIGGGVLVVFGERAGWFEKTASTEPSPPPSDIVRSRAATTLPPVSDAQPVEVPAASPVGPVTRTVEDIRRDVFARMVKAARQRENNRSKPLCRRLTAEAFAAEGRLEDARGELARLTVVGRKLPYLQVLPLVTIAWKQLDAGDRNAASSTLREAVVRARTLLPDNPESVEAATELAVALWAIESPDRGTRLPLTADRGPRWTQRARLRRCRMFGRFDIDAETLGEPVPGHADPVIATVTAGLVERGYSEAALQHVIALAATEAGDRRLEVTGGCLAAWAGTRVRVAGEIQPKELQGEIERAQSSLTGVGAYGGRITARALARAAVALLDAGDRALATEVVALAKTALAEDSTHAEPAPMGLAEIYDFRLPDPGPLRLELAACADLARAQSVLEPDDAAVWFIRALACARGIGPSPTLTRRLLDEIKLRRTAVAARLKQQFNLVSDDEITTRMRRYHDKCRELDVAAGQRLELVIALLDAAADWNLLDLAFNDVKQRFAARSAVRHEPFGTTLLPDRLRIRFEAAGRSDTVAELRQLFTTSPTDFSERLRQSTGERIKQGNLAAVVAAVIADAARRPEAILRAERHDWLLRLAARIARAGNTEAALKFIEAFNDPRSTLWREQAYELTAALAARLHDDAPSVIWNHVVAKHTEQVALLAGMLAGMRARQSTTPESQQDR